MRVIYFYVSNSQTMLEIQVLTGTTAWNVFLSVLVEGVQFSSVQLLSRVQLFVTPWTTARQAYLSITNSQSLPKLMSIESVMPSNHLILVEGERGLFCLLL